MTVLASGVIQSRCYGLTHEGIRPIGFLSAGPDVINQDFTDKGQTLRTWVAALSHDDCGNPPFPPFLPLAL